MQNQATANSTKRALVKLSVAGTITIQLFGQVSVPNLSLTSGTASCQSSSALRVSGGFTVNVNPLNGSVGGNASVILQSASSIDLRPGFHAAAGNSSVAFDASIVKPAMPTLAITTDGTLRAATTGTVYSTSLAATAGCGTLNWFVAADSLPAGLMLNPATGVISGTPTSAGASGFTIGVSDSILTMATKAFSVMIGLPLTITTSSLPAGTVGAVYSATLSASGGTYPYAWTLTAGALPSGLTLNASTGVVAGTANATGSSIFTIAATDSTGQVVQRQFTVSIGLVSVTLTSAPVTGLSLSVDGNSGACTTPCVFHWNAGSIHSIGVIPIVQPGAAGTQYVFQNWSGQSGQTLQITVPANSLSETANFVTQYQLTTASNPSNGGAIAPVSGTWYTSGLSASVTASPNPGYTFTGFSGSLTGTSPSGTILMNSANSVTANFSAVTIPITLTSSPVGRILTVDGATCTTPCPVVRWIQGSSHTIAPEAQTEPDVSSSGIRYVFSGWSDGGAASHFVTPNAAATYTATFDKQFQLAVAANPVAGGTVSLSPNGGWYVSGTLVTVSAQANAGYSFASYSGGLTGTSASQNVTVTGALAATSNFTGAATGLSLSREFIRFGGRLLAIENIAAVALTLNPTDNSSSHLASAGTGSCTNPTGFTVTTTGSYTATASAADGWIHLCSPTTGTHSGSISYWVDPYALADPSPRIGGIMVSVAGTSPAIYSVYQDGATATILPVSATVELASAAGSATQDFTSNANWAASVRIPTM